MQTDFGIVVALQKELDAVKEALHESEELSIPGTLPFLRGTPPDLAQSSSDRPLALTSVCMCRPQISTKVNGTVNET